MCQSNISRLVESELREEDGCVGCGEGGEGPDWWSQSSGLQVDVENVGLRVRRPLVGRVKAEGIK